MYPAPSGIFPIRTLPAKAESIRRSRQGFATAQNLKELSINFTYARSIDLSNCSRLEKFRCTAVLEPDKITLPKYFPLKEFTFDESIWWCFTKRQLNYKIPSEDVICRPAASISGRSFFMVSAAIHFLPMRTVRTRLRLLTISIGAKRLLKPACLRSVPS